ncbi:hypothetical protein D3C71_1542040 [compost metagenome]
MESSHAVVQKFNRLSRLQLNDIIQQLHEMVRLRFGFLQLFEQPFVGGEQDFIMSQDQSSGEHDVIGAGIVHQQLVVSF